MILDDIKKQLRLKFKLKNLGLIRGKSENEIDRKIERKTKRDRERKRDKESFKRHWLCRSLGQ